ncbi:MAG: DUF4270 family protein [Bacteroidales bacterium]|nr:DUF4270 family protein [Bacteroidales bacterium]
MHSFFKAAALTFAISISFFASSCIEVDKTLGAGNIPDDQALVLKTASFHLPLQTKMMDSLQALTTSYAVLGAFRTPEFGLAQFCFATNYAPYYTQKKINLGNDRKIKEIYLTIQRTSTTVMDQSQKSLPQNIRVYRMNRSVDTTSRFGYLKDSDYNHTQIDTGSVVYTGGDTLRIWLKNSFGQQILNASQLELDSSRIFMDKFKALLFTCDPPEDGTNGGRLNVLSTTNAFINITFSFQPTWKSGLARKDSVFVIPLADNTYTQNFSTYESKPQESTDAKEYVMVEGIGGLKAYVDPMVLKDTLDRWVAKQGYDPKKILIGKATYKLPFVTDNSTVSSVNYYYPANLYPNNKEWDTKGSFYYYAPLEDVYTTSNNAGDINRSLSCYMGDISSMIQKLVINDRADIQSSWKKYAIWFSPVNKSTSSNVYSTSSTTSYSTDASSYFIGKLNGPLHANYPRVEIIYAVMND